LKHPGEEIYLEAGGRAPIVVADVAADRAAAFQGEVDGDVLEPIS
jgi:acyl-CoA reductase-like NAD-dependent aldehyde dehydrogenase